MSLDSISKVEEEILRLQKVLTSVEIEIHEVNKAIDEAEKHILENDKVNFWEPKLNSLRQDKAFMLKKVEKLQEEAIVLEKTRLALVESANSEFGFFHVDDDDDEAVNRGRNTTWACDGIALLTQKKSSALDADKDVVKKVESSPSIMTQVEGDNFLNKDPNANLQGQNRRPHMGNLKGKPIDRVDSFNIFGVKIEEEDENVSGDQDISESVLKNLSKPGLSRGISNVSIASEASESDQPFSIGKLFYDFFNASESLLISQSNNNPTPETSRTSSTDKLSSPRLRSRKSKENISRPGIQPAESAHDFSVFGADMYNDNDDAS